MEGTKSGQALLSVVNQIRDGRMLLISREKKWIDIKDSKGDMKSTGDRLSIIKVIPKFLADPNKYF